MLDLALSVLTPFKNSLTAEFGASAPPVFINRPADTVVRGGVEVPLEPPYIWLRPGNDLPLPYTTIKPYKLTEVALDIWATDERQASRIDGCAVFLEDYDPANYGDAFGMTFTSGRRATFPEPYAQRISRTFNVYYFDKRLRGLA